MEGSVSGSVVGAAENLHQAAQDFADKIQAAADSGVDLGQEVISTAVNTVLGAAKTALGAAHDLASKA